MRSGSPALFDVALFDAGIAGLTYADKAAFEAAGWTLEFIDMSTGAAAVPTVSYTITPVAGVDGRHTVRFTLPAQELWVRFTPPATTYSWQVLPGAVWSGEANDADTVYARVNSVYGLSTQIAVPTTTLLPTVETDSYACTVVIPTAYLTRLGWTDLTGVTLTGSIRDQDDNGTGTARALLVTGAPAASEGQIAVNGANPAAIDISWTSYPTGMALTTSERTAGKTTLRVTIEATLAGKQLTVLYAGPLVVSRKDLFA